MDNICAKTRKIQFTKAKAKRIAAEDNNIVRGYRCHYCNRYHLTSKKTSELRRIGKEKKKQISPNAIFNLINSELILKKLNNL